MKHTCRLCGHIAFADRRLSHCPDCHRSYHKPFNDCAGYIASRKNPFTEGWLVLYDAQQAGMEVSGGPYATVCETHGTIANHRTLALARSHLPTAAWCEACTALAQPLESGSSLPAGRTA
jgi:hypothetical protein